MGRIVCFGELLLRLGAPGRELLLQSPQLQVHVGGAEANVAVSLSRFGHDVAMVSTVAGNALGAHALAELRRHGVDTRGVSEDAEGRMGLYFLTPGAVRRPSEVLYDRAGSAFVEHVDTAFDWDQLLDGVEWLHASGVTPATGPNGSAAAVAIIEAAVRKGVKVSYDGNFRGKLWEQWDGDPPATLGKMLAGEVSWRNLSGPVTIADYAGQSARLGIDYYLKFMALVSISLGVLNLLPIPVLDGGHLMYHMIEVVRRRPLSERAMEISQQVGLSILFVLMAFAFFNDMNRLFSG